MELTNYQYKQLLSIKLEGDFNYKNDSGNKSPRQAWKLMIDTLTKNKLIVINNGPKITELGIKVLSEYLGIK